MAELQFDIGAIVDITLAVSEKVRAKYDLELELVNDELAEANAEIERLQAKVEAMELLGDFEAIQADIDKLTEQKDRQAKTIQELMEKLEAADKRADNAILESVDAGAVAKQKEEIRRLEEMNEKLKAENKELTKKLKEAEQRGDAVVRRSENWIRPSEKEPPTETWVIVTTQTGAVIDARYVMGKNGMELQRSNYQPIKQPLAWMSKPEPVEKEAKA